MRILKIQKYHPRLVRSPGRPRHATRRKNYSVVFIINKNIRLMAQMKPYRVVRRARRRLVHRRLQAAPQQLRLGRRGQPQRRELVRLQQRRRAARRAPAARLAAPHRRRALHVRVVHREVLLDHAVDRHRRLRELRQVASG